MKVILVGLMAVGLSAATAVSPEGNYTVQGLFNKAGPRGGKGQTSCDCGWTNIMGRIMGGREAGRNEYPMIVHLPRQGCGGTIITPWHVLTAAHCTKGIKPSSVRIYAGAHEFGKSEHVYRVSKIINHEYYNGKTYENDISLLVTSTKMDFNKYVGPACMPGEELHLVGETVKALGWGTLKSGGRDSDVLREVDLRVISRGQCEKYWAGKLFDTNSCSFESRKDTCQGDSGGPLIWFDREINRYTLVSLVSYGSVCGSAPGVNTDVTKYLDWIDRKISASKPVAKTCTKI